MPTDEFCWRDCSKDYALTQQLIESLASNGFSQFSETIRCAIQDCLFLRDMDEFAQNLPAPKDISLESGNICERVRELLSLLFTETEIWQACTAMSFPPELHRGLFDRGKTVAMSETTRGILHDEALLAKLIGLHQNASYVSEHWGQMAKPGKRAQHFQQTLISRLVKDLKVMQDSTLTNEKMEHLIGIVCESMNLPHKDIHRRFLGAINGTKRSIVLKTGRN